MCGEGLPDAFDGGEVVGVRIHSWLGQEDEAGAGEGRHDPRRAERDGRGERDAVASSPACERESDREGNDDVQGQRQVVRVRGQGAQVTSDAPE